MIGDNDVSKAAFDPPNKFTRTIIASGLTEKNVQEHFPGPKNLFPPFGNGSTFYICN